MMAEVERPMPMLWSSKEGLNNPFFLKTYTNNKGLPNLDYANFFPSSHT